MKKILLLFSFFILLFGFDVYAADKTIFTVKSVEASAGSEVTVSINMKNNPKYELLSMKIPIDMEKVEFVDCNINGFSDAMLKGCSVNPNNDLIFYALTMYTEEAKLLKDTGDIFDIHLKIKEGVKKDIPITLTVTDYGKTETQPLEYEVMNGLIKVSGDVETKTVETTESLGEEIKNPKDGKVTWKSSNKEVATVDKEGNVEFRGSGNTTITAVDKDGKILYEKTYLVNKEAPKNYTLIWIIGIVCVVVLVVVALVVFLLKKKKKKNTFEKPKEKKKKEKKEKVKKGKEEEILEDEEKE